MMLGIGFRPMDAEIERGGVLVTIL
jgi:hypothetical protein